MNFEEKMTSKKSLSVCLNTSIIIRVYTTAVTDTLVLMQYYFLRNKRKE